jgi:hypothetical protein
MMAMAVRISYLGEQLRVEHASRDGCNGCKEYICVKPEREQDGS